MKNILKLEEIATLILTIFFYQSLNWAWYWYLVWFLVPDLGMLGYLINTKVGALTYNLAHHKGIAIGFGLIGYVLMNHTMLFIGILLLGHAAFDRIFGYGLKYDDSFHHTHLGMIGKKGI